VRTLNASAGTGNGASSVVNKATPRVISHPAPKIAAGGQCAAVDGAVPVGCGKIEESHEDGPEGDAAKSNKLKTESSPSSPWILILFAFAAVWLIKGILAELRKT